MTPASARSAGIGVQDRAGEAPVELRIGFGDVDLPQRDLAVRPGHLESAIGKATVLVLLRQVQAGGAALADAGDQVERCRLQRLEGEALPDGDDRVQHGAFAARERAVIAQRLRVAHAVAAADETRPVGFVGHLRGLRAVQRHQMQHPGRRFLARARPARAQDGLPGVHDLGLHEQVAERRVQGVRGSGGEHHFRIAGHFDGAARAGAVGDANPAQFDVILGRHHDFRVGVELRVVAAELHPLLGEDRFVGFGALQCRLEGG